jgi:hypothetical protein
MAFNDSDICKVALIDECAGGLEADRITFHSYHRAAGAHRS